MVDLVERYICLCEFMICFTSFLWRMGSFKSIPFVFALLTGTANSLCSCGKKETTVAASNCDVPSRLQTIFIHALTDINAYGVRISRDPVQVSSNNMARPLSPSTNFLRPHALCYKLCPMSTVEQLDLQPEIRII